MKHWNGKMTLKKLASFLVEAKRATYAGNGSKKRLPDGSKELIYEKDNLRYKDKYFGSKSFSGQEIVFNKGKPIWSMNYCGKSFKNLLFTKKLFIFLKKTLSEVTESLPFRGPKKFIEGIWKYENKWQGDLKKFKGKEKIFYKNKLVYKLEYFGGYV